MSSDIRTTAFDSIIESKYVAFVMVTYKHYYVIRNEGVKMEELLFENMDLSQEVKMALADMGFEEATPIQSKAIPELMLGKDVIGQAQTGTGKTCAFGIPAIEKIIPKEDGVQVLVLCPTRELAIQSSEEIKNVAKYKRGIKILPIYGGQQIERQIRGLRSNPQIIIGTPGRVMDHMRRNTLKFDNLKMLILDEADEMLNMGFREDIDTILQSIHGERQTILFSATMPKEILDLTKKYQKNSVLVKAAHKELTVPSIEQYYLEIRENQKSDVLSRIIDANNITLSMVFCNTKRKVDEVSMNLQSMGYSVEALHGDMKQAQRDKVMASFRKGNVDILVATDVAARGIDVDDVEAVFNYDVPSDEEYYVHRIGRTGRAGRTGKSYTFAYGRDIYKLKDIQRYTKSKIKLIKPPSLADVEETKINNIFEGIKNQLDSTDLTKYINYIEKFLENYSSGNEQDEGSYPTSIDVAAAFLKSSLEKNSLKQDEPDEFNETGAEQGMVRLFINMGKKDRLLPRNILEGICRATDLPGSLVGTIDIYDKFSFIEVPKNYAKEVLLAVQNIRINGRRVNIEPANKKG